MKNLLKNRSKIGVKNRSKNRSEIWPKNNRQNHRQNPNFLWKKNTKILMFWDRLGAKSITDFSRPKCWNASCVTREQNAIFFGFFELFFASQFCGKPTPLKILKSSPKIGPKNIRNPFPKLVRKLSEILSQNRFEN